MDTVTRRYHRTTPFNVGYVFVKLNHYMTVINFYSYWTQLGLSHGHQYGCYTVCALYKPILTFKNLGLGNCYSWSHFISSCLFIVPPSPLYRKGTQRRITTGILKPQKFEEWTNFGSSIVFGKSFGGSLGGCKFNIQNALLCYSICQSLLASQFRSYFYPIPALYIEIPDFWSNIFPQHSTARCLLFGPWTAQERRVNEGGGMDHVGGKQMFADVHAKLFWCEIYCAKSRPNIRSQSNSQYCRGLGSWALRIIIEYDLANAIVIQLSI